MHGTWCSYSSGLPKAVPPLCQPGGLARGLMFVLIPVSQHVLYDQALLFPVVVPASGLLTTPQTLLDDRAAYSYKPYEHTHSSFNSHVRKKP